jgi:hypothetical protein
MINLTRALLLNNNIKNRVFTKSYSVFNSTGNRNLISKNIKNFSLTEQRFVQKSAESNISSRNSSLFKYVAVFALGATGIYLLSDKLNLNKEKVPKSNGSGPLKRIDLNDVYERTAVLFLSNKEACLKKYISIYIYNKAHFILQIKFRETLGMPIKITSSEADDVRTLNLRREGETLFSFIAYNVEGSQNSGTVFCKLIIVKYLKLS